MTEAMPFLQKAILLSYDPRPFCGGIFESAIEGSALAELRSATGSLQTVLRSFLSRFSLVFRAFPDFSLFSYPMW